jgi:hypothetical protein
MADTTRVEGPDVLPASKGAGPLLQRDYWAVIAGTSLSPEEIITKVRQSFPDFAPPETAAFDRGGRPANPLEVGDQMDICIAMLGGCKVRVVHTDRLSLTLRTLEGHPEAGRITFGCGRDDQGRIVFRIRSRTRAGGWVKYLGFLLMGKQMQSRTWIRFIGNLAHACGGSVQGSVQVSTIRVADRFADEGGLDAPTFVARDPEAG